MEKSLLKRMEGIKAFVIDLDGTLTDGKLLMLENGELLRHIHIRDAEAVRLAAGKRFSIALISELGGLAAGNLFKTLGVRETYLEVENKMLAYERFMLEFGFASEDIAYLGDDTADIPCLQVSGLSCCPADAPEDVKMHAHYVARGSGGNGAVREVIQMVMRCQGETVL